MNIQIEDIVSLCKRRGFVYPSSELYGGFAAVYDYGPYGVELLQNIKQLWWKSMVQEHSNIVGLDSAIFMSNKIWEASGHVGGFSDPMSECRNCHVRSRVDHLLEDVGVAADEKMSEEDINALLQQHAEQVKCPSCGKSDFSPAKNFNMLVKSNLGDFTDSNEEPAYLRGETAQGIYVNYKNVVDSMRVKVPFGIAQIGKAFRNEITARQFIFRTREFEQMEMQYFVHPDNAQEEYEKWKEIRWKYYTDTLGFDEKHIQWHQHENLVFYAKDAWDIEYEFPFGMKELEGIHNRSDYDLTQHSKHSGKELNYRDPHTNEVYVPWIVETSVGSNRTFLAVMTEAYTQEEVDGEERIVLKLPKALAPIKVAVMPLQKKGLSDLATEVFDELKGKYMCEYDESGSIGKRYRRQDEIGTPLCVTVDYDSLEDQAVTVRNRDTMKQERIPRAQLQNYLAEFYQ